MALVEIEADQGVPMKPIRQSVVRTAVGPRAGMLVCAAAAGVVGRIA
jgi:hypothetical protein